MDICDGIGLGRWTAINMVRGAGFMPEMGVPRILTAGQVSVVDVVVIPGCISGGRYITLVFIVVTCGTDSVPSCLAPLVLLFSSLFWWTRSDCALWYIGGYISSGCVVPSALSTGALSG